MKKEVSSELTESIGERVKTMVDAPFFFDLDPIKRKPVIIY